MKIAPYKHKYDKDQIYTHYPKHRGKFPFCLSVSHVWQVHFLYLLSSCIKTFSYCQMFYQSFQMVCCCMAFTSIYNFSTRVIANIQMFTAVCYQVVNEFFNRILVAQTGYWMQRVRFAYYMFCWSRHSTFRNQVYNNLFIFIGHDYNPNNCLRAALFLPMRNSKSTRSLPTAGIMRIILRVA